MRKKNQPNMTRKILAGLSLSGLLALSARAADGVGPYFNVEAGISIMEDARGSVARFSTDPGARLTIAPGYTFYSSDNLNVSGEMETGVIYNSLSSVSAFGSTMPMEGDWYQVPFLANLVL